MLERCLVFVSTGGALVVVRLDALGAEIWSQRFSVVDTRIEAAVIVPSASDGVWLAGSLRSSLEDTPTDTDVAWIAALDRAGAPLWFKQAEDFSALHAGAVAAGGGSAVFAGRIGQADSTEKLGWLVQVDTDGVIQKQTSYGSDDDHGVAGDFSAIRQASADGFWVAGRLFRDCGGIVLRTTTGCFAWTQSLEISREVILRTATEDILQDMVVRDDSSVLLAGRHGASNSRDTEDALMMQVAPGLASALTVRMQGLGEQGSETVNMDSL